MRGDQCPDKRGSKDCVEVKADGACHEPGSRPLLGPSTDGDLIMDFPASRSPRRICQLFIGHSDWNFTIANRDKDGSFPGIVSFTSELSQTISLKTVYSNQGLPESKHCIQLFCL